MVQENSVNATGSDSVQFSPVDMCDEFVAEDVLELGLIDMCKRMVAMEMLDRGIKRPDAERIVAQRAQIAPSAIDNLRWGKIKNVETLGAKISRAFEDFLDRQIRQLQNELAIARASRREVDFVAAEAAIRAAKAALGKR